MASEIARLWRDPLAMEDALAQSLEMLPKDKRAGLRRAVKQAAADAEKAAARAAQEIAWPHMTKEGEPSTRSYCNVETFAAHAGLVVRHCELSGLPHVNGEQMSDEVLSDVMRQCHEAGFLVEAPILAGHLASLAYKRKFHPIREYLDSLRWDGVPRIRGWLTAYCGADDSDIIDEFGHTFFLGAVRRVREPGAKFDLTLLLIGKQGDGKSSLVTALSPHFDWVLEGFPAGADDKIMIERLAGKWLCEYGELAAQSSRSMEAIKDSLTRRSFTARRAFGRVTSTIHRQDVVIATTNDHNPLIDGTGGRRFMPVRVGRIDLDAVAAARDQLWAEAAHLEAETRGQVNIAEHLWAAAAELQEDARQVSVIEERLHSAFADEGSHPAGKIETQEIYRWLDLATGNAGVSIRAQREVYQAMTRFGWEGCRFRVDGNRTYGFRKDGGCPGLIRCVVDVPTAADPTKRPPRLIQEGRTLFSAL